MYELRPLEGQEAFGLILIPKLHFSHCRLSANKFCQKYCAYIIVASFSGPSPLREGLGRGLEEEPGGKANITKDSAVVFYYLINH